MSNPTKTLMIATIALAALIPLANAEDTLNACPAAPEAPSAPAADQALATLIELRISGIETLATTQSTAHFGWSNQTASQHFTMGPQAPAALAQAFRAAPTNTTGVVDIVDVDGTCLFHVALKLDNRGLQIVDRYVDLERIVVDHANDHVVSVIAGGIQGTFSVVAQLRSAAPSSGVIGNLSMDLDGDGSITEGETAALTRQATNLTGTLQAVNAPPASTWSLSISNASTVIVRYHGTYDWISGTFVETRRDVVDPHADVVLYRVKFAPTRMSAAGVYSVPAAVIVPNVQAGDGGPQDLSRFGLELTFGEPEPTTTPGGPDGSTDPSGPGPDIASPNVPGLPSWVPWFVLAMAGLLVIVGITIVGARRRGRAGS